ncbi:c-type cytochrome [Mesorhizobium sp. RP14(2022)]|uniref:C-type cytochrome n=1 Tax=Mesorhizobium liriopis TaxID=2953882 RepID=A0ABT1C5Y5_9HYPH|nr:c-type cytochrome [Mesorhizobium liriopis]MCO6050214.1 c-type cytochrome [Mesorhizobium liriopis]
MLILFTVAFLAGTVSLSLFYIQTEKRTRVAAEQATGGHAEAAQALMSHYGCGSCHEIPGIAKANGKVGPSLEGFAGRAEIAGLLSNQPNNLVFWLREPQKVSPGNGMPDQGVTEGEARNMAAYLYTLQ